MDRLSIEALSVFDLPPLEFVDLAADLECGYITVLLQDLASLPLGYPPFSLKEDKPLRRDLLAAMDDRGVQISLGDGFLVLPDADMCAYCADLDVLAELCVPRINVVSLDPSLERTFDQVGTLAELAAQRHIETLIEPIPGLTIGDLPSALAAIEHIARPDVRLLIDAMHLVRSGSGPSDLAAVDPDRIGYAQLCDTTLTAHSDNYAEEALFERLVPGEGELPLPDVLAALPDDIVIGLEVPMRSLALAGVGPADRLRPCVQAARALLTETSRQRACGRVDLLGAAFAGLPDRRADLPILEIGDRLGQDDQ